MVSGVAAHPNKTKKNAEEPEDRRVLRVCRLCCRPATQSPQHLAHPLRNDQAQTKPRLIHGLTQPAPVPRGWTLNKKGGKQKEFLVPDPRPGLDGPNASG